MLRNPEKREKIMKRFARAILDAQKIREESFDTKAANKAEKELKAPHRLYIDFSKFYKKSMQDAADEAAANAGFGECGSLPIYLLNQYCWNDIQAWAEENKK